MARHYKHSQAGYLTAGASGAATAYTVGKLMLGAAKVPYLALAALFGGIGLAFSSLTIEIEDGTLSSYFGPGVPAKTVELDDIEAVDVVTNPWYYGWGIRYTPRGWLYNVSGFDAVEIRLRDGKQFRLGTDEPERLRDAILEARGIDV